MNPVPLLRSPLLAALPGIRHAFFTRRGGTSRGLYASLNLGRGSRDDPAAVEANRAAIVADAFGVGTDWLLYRLPDSFRCRACRGGALGDVARGRCDRHADGGPRTRRAVGRLRADPAGRRRGRDRGQRPRGLEGRARRRRRAGRGGHGRPGRGADPDRRRSRPLHRPPDSYEVGLEFLERFEGEALARNGSSPPARGRESGCSTCPASFLPGCAAPASARVTGSVATPAPRRPTSSPTAAPCCAARATTAG